MKRSHLQFEELERTDLLRLLAEISSKLREERVAILNQIPPEVWRLIWMECIAVTQKSTIFILACVCRRWSSMCDDVIRELYQENKFESDRTLLRFLDTTEVCARRPIQRSSPYYKLSGITGLSLTRLENLTSLKLLNGYAAIKSHHIVHPEKLQTLSIPDNYRFDDDDLLKMTNLTSLGLRHNHYITDNAVSQLTRLRFLNLSENHDITSGALCKLNLTGLKLMMNSKVNNQSLLRIKTLTSLSLDFNTKIKNSTLAKLTNLTKLSVVGYSIITDEGIYKLTNMTDLDATDNSEITNHGLRLLTRLTKLCPAPHINNAGVQHLCNLTHLRLNSHITLDALVHLPKLTTLDISESNISQNDLSQLTGLNIIKF
jgi:hypothetical protein